MTVLRAVFLDRDGTIGGTGGGMHPFEFQLYDFAPVAIKTLNDLGIKVFLFTNQTRVGRGFFTEKVLLKGFKLMEEELARHDAFLDGIYYCPHNPEEGCTCQKPNIGLLLQAKEEHGLNLEACYIVGDTGGSDMLAASKAGTKMVLVRTGWGEGSLTKYRSHWLGIDPDYVAKDLLEAVEWISLDIQNQHSVS
ncbi:D-glycero-alpha-D-manno-heptose-1,7-bisphosphate 7-phosphatase [Planococcus halotolerans]|uniref:D-glycero-alpha-D-manno-heptose-1,7-bisphosphate 7-phosphatase n=1 Tax=Planococcus halotolerans TaxID=2233542 RepID=UPI001092C575|nr:HAD-IIIA family hydrolase [Planococcus halotolerans]QHJ71305.1 HAD-IIIA family hydrolase [Planococcus halotolerans]